MCTQRRICIENVFIQSSSFARAASGKFSFIFTFETQEIGMKRDRENEGHSTKLMNRSALTRLESRCAEFDIKRVKNKKQGNTSIRKRK